MKNKKEGKKSTNQPLKIKLVTLMTSADPELDLSAGNLARNPAGAGTPERLSAASNLQ